MNGEEIRRRMHSGEVTYGTHIALMSNPVAASMLADVPLDFAFLCGEHMPLDRTEASTLCCLYASKGVSPIVRIPQPCPVAAAQALDAGAQGILAPYIETEQQVRDIVGAVHCRPVKGKLLAEYQSGRRKPGPKMALFFERFNRHNYAIIGIESMPAYENLDRLIAVEGVDCVFIGPHDLSVSMGVPEEWDNPEFHRIIEDIVVRCRAVGVGVGVHMNPTIFPLDRVRRLLELGMNWILDAADVVWAIHGLKDRRRLLGTESGVETPGADRGVSSCLVGE